MPYFMSSHYTIYTHHKYNIINRSHKTQEENNSKNYHTETT